VFTKTVQKRLIRKGCSELQILGFEDNVGAFRAEKDFIVAFACHGKGEWVFFDGDVK
jgi:hypothetical protein